jgi:hypothetical protein
MAITWGGSALTVLAGTWSPSQGAPVMTEIQLLPNASTPTTVATVLQQAGRKRRKVKATLKLANMTAYNSLLSDMESGTSRTLADGDTVNASYVITDLGDAKALPLSFVTATIEFMEA